MFLLIELVLPPANEVRDKVMSSQACVIHGDWLPSMHHKSHDQEVYIQGIHIQVGVGQSHPLQGHIGYYWMWSTSEQYASYFNAFLLRLISSTYKIHLIGDFINMEFD